MKIEIYGMGCPKCRATMGNVKSSEGDGPRATGRGIRSEGYKGSHC